VKPLDQIKRILMYSLVVSVLVGALVGILAVLRNEWGAFEVRVLLTTVVLAIASLCGLACDLSRTPRGLNLIPYGGMILTTAGLGMILYLIWGADHNDFWKLAFCTSIFAVATAHISLLSVARLAPRFQWVVWGAYCIIYGLASMLASIIINEPPIPDELVLRQIAVLSILDVAVTLVIPLLHRISKTDPNCGQLSLQDEQNIATVDDEIEKLQRRLEQLRTIRNHLEKPINPFAPTHITSTS
jgi:hypothetical protein